MFNFKIDLGAYQAADAFWGVFCGLLIAPFLVAVLKLFGLINIGWLFVIAPWAVALAILIWLAIMFSRDGFK